MMLSEADHLIALLQLAPHPEGGHYRETFRDGEGRGHSSAIHFLLKAGEVSWWHRIDAAEVWHFHRGAPLELSIAENGIVTQHVLGAAIEQGEQPQIVVPPGAWQMAKTQGEYTLVGCTVAPGFEFARFELAPRDFRI
jgi:predicted cupin superfamily sugar epimerase